MWPTVMQVQICAYFCQINSTSVPFEEDEQNPNIWFLDHNFLENMGAMFRKVSGKFIIV
jgi:hypothetical protein